MQMCVYVLIHVYIMSAHCMCVRDFFARTEVQGTIVATQNHAPAARRTTAVGLQAIDCLVDRPTREGRGLILKEERAS